MSSKYVICINNDGYEVSLERRKIYETVADDVASDHDQLRVIDESGDDYLYPSSLFVQIDLPKSVQDRFIDAA